MNQQHTNGNLIFDTMMANLGESLARNAVEHAEQADDNWNKVRAMFQTIKGMGMEQEAVEKLYERGERLPQAKADWYRKQKRLVKLAVQYQIDFSNLSQRETERLVAQRRDAERTPEQRKEDSLRMMQRTFKGAMDRVEQGEVLAHLQQVIQPQEPAQEARPARAKAPVQAKAPRGATKRTGGRKTAARKR